MPGFFITFLLLAAVAAWTRYLTQTRGPDWLIWYPGPALLVWLLTTVYAAATLQTTPRIDETLPPEQAAEQRMREQHGRLTNVATAANVGQWVALVTIVGVLPLTVWVYRSAPQREEAG